MEGVMTRANFLTVNTRYNILSFFLVFQRKNKCSKAFWGNSGGKSGNL
jgi:hypothetical protein